MRGFFCSASFDAIEMLSAEEYSEMAAFYEKAADDAKISRGGRMMFARRANWLRMLARLAAKQASKPCAREVSQRDTIQNNWGELEGDALSEALLFSPTRLAAAAPITWEREGRGLKSAKDVARKQQRNVTSSISKLWPLTNGIATCV